MMPNNLREPQIITPQNGTALTRFHGNLMPQSNPVPEGLGMIRQVLLLFISSGVKPQ